MHSWVLCEFRSTNWAGQSYPTHWPVLSHPWPVVSHPWPVLPHPWPLLSHPWPVSSHLLAGLIPPTGRSYPTHGRSYLTTQTDTKHVQDTIRAGIDCIDLGKVVKHLVLLTFWTDLIPSVAAFLIVFGPSDCVWLALLIVFIGTTSSVIMNFVVPSTPLPGPVLSHPWPVLSHPWAFLSHPPGRTANSLRSGVREPLPVENLQRCPGGRLLA